MDTIKYAQTVARMREAQRSYFRDRTNGNLQRAKDLEAIVDRDTAAILKGEPKEQPPIQATLL